MKKLIQIFILFIVGNFCNAQTVIYNENFETNANEWESTNTGYKAEIKKGALIIENTTDDQTKWVLKDIFSSADEVDFDIETEIEIIKSDKDYNSYGLVWSCYRNKKYYRVIRLTPDGQSQLYYYNNSTFDYYKAWSKDKFVNGYKKKNKIKVEKRGSMSTVYINDTKVHEQAITHYGSLIGFILDKNMKMEVHSLKVTSYEKAKVNVIEEYDPNLKISKVEALSSPDTQEVLPIVTADGKTMYMVLKDSKENIGDKKNDDIWFSTKDDKGNWLPYKNIGRPLNNDSHNYVVSVSPDNNTLLLGNRYNPDGKSSSGKGVSIANKTRDGWEIPKPMEIESFVNLDEHCEYFLSNTKKELLMTIETKESIGYRDMYVSFSTGQNSWSEPISLGSVINTSGDEAYPFMASDGKTLYFASQGHPGYGGYDLFVTKRLDDTWTNWSEPKNLGDVINTPNSEMSIFLTAKGDKAYVVRDSDIYEVINKVKQDPVILVRGKVYDSKTNKILSAPISYNNLKTNKEIGTAISDPNTGEYSIVLPYGDNYSFMAEKDGYYAVTQNVDLRNLNEYKEIEVDLYLNPIEKGQTIRLNNIFFNSGKFDLLEESNAELDKLYAILKANNNLVIEIAGHTDAVGSDSNNLVLSKNRANAVMSYLTQKGIPQKQLTAKGYGETKFIATNDTEEGKQLNRRVEFEIKEL
jgi:OOP family OmpA-OmpF porin